ncbi:MULTISPECIES: alpha/beta fold hydrolase [unclassified Micromonospora]|uniref:thioesterase II family protein n=1 Tax=unclassified Micromonospora TaxID=2617518 RepID=UPI0022B65F6C|nr:MULTISPECIES: alpha/beta fold hydrolase [unclassified Micromonospora]MCZ7421954.1 alpha/beta fold hydrolase [Verrucosispora sp. WMMA2121]WBB93312.1 alpha/beta fold hydrolase [Verrucosispora sp. WMMC514]
MSRWIRTRTRQEPADLDLICFPHAGGSASFFRLWPDLLPTRIRLHTVQYPGREERLTEPCVTSMAEMADAVAAAVLPVVTGPVMLFGHSMGAALGYETTVRLERAGVVGEGLVVSGQPAPHRRKPKSLHLAADEELLADIDRIGAAGSSLLRADADLRDLLLPMIRADYRVIETYQSPAGQRLRTPITVFRSDGDEDVTAEEAAAWADRTLHYRGERVFPGGHFYLQERCAEVVGALVDEAMAGERWDGIGQPVP